MPSIEALPDPTTREFTPYTTGAPPSRVMIGRNFLAGAYYDPSNERKEKIYDYGRALIEQVKLTELPFREIIVTWNTFATVVAGLRSKVSDRAAQKCVEEVQDEDYFSIVYPSEDIYRDSISTFTEWDGDKPNLHEVADHGYLQNEGLEYYLTWDSDFTAFEDITLLPHCYWDN